MAGEFRRPYRDAFGYGMRPYLTVRLIGVAGHEMKAVGLVDSGADVTCLPMLTAPLLGLGPGQLERAEIRQLGGTRRRAWRARMPLRAQLTGFEPPTGIEIPEFELVPLFVEGSTHVLLGRDDFFRSFERVCFHELDWAMTLAAA